MPAYRKRKRDNGNGGVARKLPKLPPRARGHYRRVGWYGRFGAPRERKFFEDNKAATLVTSGAPQIFRNSINLVAQGATESERVGRRMIVTRVMIRFIAKIPAATVAGDVSDVLRVMVYVDRQANGATATYGDILNSASVLSYNNLVNSGRFHTLMDKTFPMVCASGVSFGGFSGEYQKVWTFSKKVRIPIEFSGATGAMGEVKSNNIGVLVASNEGLCFVEFKSRIRFADGC